MTEATIHTDVIDEATIHIEVVDEATIHTDVVDEATIHTDQVPYNANDRACCILMNNAVLTMHLRHSSVDIRGVLASTFFFATALPKFP
ncbi:hypothetical protein J6590_031707 [Homalodisca vitripennis]|nr:hypothetical protein J6590_031707 [Homalodisca vitripennis]